MIDKIILMSFVSSGASFTCLETEDFMNRAERMGFKPQVTWVDEEHFATIHSNSRDWVLTLSKDGKTCIVRRGQTLLNHLTCKNPNERKINEY